VCNNEYSVENLKQKIADVFSALIEINRKTKKDARLSMGVRFGGIVLSMSGEIYFERGSQITGQDFDEVRSIFKSRNKIRSDAISVIDAASSILSQGGGKAFSVRSDFFKQLSSVATPASNFSKSTKTRSNTIVSENGQQKFFSRYRARSKVPLTTDEIFEAKDSQKSKELTQDALNYLDTENAKPKSKASRSLFSHNSIQEMPQNRYVSSLPDEQSKHPHLKAFIERGMGHRLSKKMVFEKLNK